MKKIGGEQIRLIIKILIPIILLGIAILIYFSWAKETDETSETEMEQTENELESIQESDGTGLYDDSDEEDITEEEGTEEQDPGEELLNQENDLSPAEIYLSDDESISIGIDVSKYQGGTIDWQQVAATGIDFVMVRIGYRTTVNGEITEDPTAAYNIQQAIAAGIKVGAYFFSTAVTEEEAEAEALWTIQYLTPYSITYPVAFNCEGFQDTSSRQYNLSSSERTDLAVTFLDTIADAGYTPMFYASKNELENDAEWNTSLLENQYLMWVAQYPQIPYPETESSSYSGVLQMWQYTTEGTISGIDTKVDFNIAYFSYNETKEALDDSVSVASAEANPEIGINFQEVSETVTPKEKTNLRSIPSSLSSDTIVTTVINGDLLTRTGIGDNGWSRVIYQGETLYAVTSYLTTSLEDTGETDKSGVITNSVSETVTAKDTVNLRSTPSSLDETNIVAELTYGESVTRTGIRTDGWSVLSYNGQTVYAVTNLLTTDFSYQNSVTPTVENPETIYTYETVSDRVTPKIEVNLRSVPSTASSDTIIATVKAGEVLERNGIGNDGWSRMTYNGQTVYAITSYLNVVP